MYGADREDDDRVKYKYEGEEFMKNRADFKDKYSGEGAYCSIKSSRTSDRHKPHFLCTFKLNDTKSFVWDHPKREQIPGNRTSRLGFLVLQLFNVSMLLKDFLLAFDVLIRKMP